MSKLRVFYIISLVILGVLVAITVFRPMGGGEEYSTVGREALLQAEDEWIIQFDIINHEGYDQIYTITAVIDGEPYHEDVSIEDDKMFTYIHHIRRDMVTEGVASFTIFKQGEEVPFEEVTYYLK